MAPSIPQRPRFSPWTLPLLALLLGTGCSWFRVDDRELADKLATATATMEEGDPGAVIHDLDMLAWHRRDSIAARQLLVEACRRTDTIESRRIAERALRELIALDPENPDYRFDLSEILLDRGFDRDARRELDGLLDRDPDHPGAHLALARYHLALYRRFGLAGDYEEMLGHFALAANLAPDDYAAQRGLAEAYLLGRQADSARGLLERLLEQWPDDGWLWALDGAALARPGSYADAARAFSQAFDRMTEDERRSFEDLRLIADPYELRHFQEMVPDEREDFLRVFWRSKDPQPVTEVNEREVEHWRRIVMADLLYAVPRYEKRGWETPRGELLIRYGEPLYTEYMQGGRALFFSIPGWYHIYAAGGGELEVTFYDMALNGMFYLPFTGLPTANDLASYEMPQGYLHDYGGRWITPVMAVGEFKGPRARTRAEVYLAMAADSLASYQGTTVAVGTVVFDPTWREVVRAEEILELDAATVAGSADRAVVHQVNLDLPPGSYIVASEIRGDAGAVVGTTTREVALDRFPADSLALSAPEIAFAVDQTGPERFKKGAVHVVPNATAEVRGEEALVVYFEIYHLAPRPVDGLAEYEVHYRISPADREGNSIWTRITNAVRAKTFIESSFVEQARGEVIRRNLTIDVSTLAQDRYRLDLEVTDLTTGSMATRTTVFRRSNP